MEVTSQKCQNKAPWSEYLSTSNLLFGHFFNKFFYTFPRFHSFPLSLLQVETRKNGLLPKAFPITQKLVPKKSSIQNSFIHWRTLNIRHLMFLSKKTRPTSSDSHDINMCGWVWWQSCIASFINNYEKKKKKRMNETKQEKFLISAVFANLQATIHTLFPIVLFYFILFYF